MKNNGLCWFSICKIYDGENSDDNFMLDCNPMSNSFTCLNLSKLNSTSAYIHIWNTFSSRATDTLVPYVN